MTAADVLRERAQKSEDSIAAYGICQPAELRALADLVEACSDVSPGRFQCRICRSAGRSDIYDVVRVHTGDCPVRAVERAFAKEVVKAELEQLRQRTGRPRNEAQD